MSSFAAFLVITWRGLISPRSSLGSGFILSKDGYVISNYHVIKDADEIWVRLSDRREYLAKPIGHDERSDLAVLKIEATDLPIVQSWPFLGS